MKNLVFGLTLVLSISSFAGSKLYKIEGDNGDSINISFEKLDQAYKAVTRARIKTHLPEGYKANVVVNQDNSLSITNLRYMAGGKEYLPVPEINYLSSTLASRLCGRLGYKYIIGGRGFNTSSVSTGEKIVQEGGFFAGDDKTFLELKENIAVIKIYTPNTISKIGAPVSLKQKGEYIRDRLIEFVTTDFTCTK